MSWAKIDDQAPHHRKLMPLGSRAPTIYGWWVASINFCRRHFTDGRITRADFPLVIPACPRIPAGVITDLERSGYWDRQDDDSWCVHDFLDHNDPAASIKQRLAEDAARKRRVRLESVRTSGGVRADVQPESTRSPRGFPAESARSPQSSIESEIENEKESRSNVGDAHRIEGRTESREAFQRLVAEVSQRVGFRP